MAKDHPDSPYRSTHRSAPTKSRTSSSPGAHAKKSGAPAKSRHAGDRHHASTASTAGTAHGKRSGKKRRRRGKGGHKTASELTSHPTSRNAQVETRAWLLRQHGPVCAYCGSRFSPRHMTLDHVAPRRGQTAYDRRDNLVLSCRACNVAKRDLAPLAFLLGLRTRATNLLKYGAHLSHGLLELARSLVREEAPSSGKDNIDYGRWDAPVTDDDDSPYRD